MAGSISATTASLIAAAVGLAGTGAGIYESKVASDNASDAQKANAAALLKQQQASANQANLTKQEAVLGQQGQAQQQTGGSLTDAGTAALTDLLAGYPGYQGGTSGAGTSTGAGVGTSGIGIGTGSSTGATTDSSSPIAAILAALQKGGASSGLGSSPTSSISGGNWQQPSAAAPQRWQELSNSPLG